MCSKAPLRLRTAGASIAGGLVVAAFLLGCSAPSPAHSASNLPEAPRRDPGGHLVLIGGGRKPKEAIALFVRLAGGKDARIVVLPLASEDSRPAGDEYVELFAQHGVQHTEVVHIDDRRDAERSAYVEAVRGATGVWFSGGDQSRIAARIVDTPLHEALRAMKRAGGVVGGTSAGTACQSHVMLTGAGGDERVVRRGNIPVSTGLGLFEGVVVDSHFIVRRRTTRLVNVLLEHPPALGVGVDEATAAWVRPNNVLEVVGESAVLVYDARSASTTEKADGTFQVEGVTETRLTAGQAFDLTTRQRAEP